VYDHNDDPDPTSPGTRTPPPAPIADSPLQELFKVLVPLVDASTQLVDTIVHSLRRRPVRIGLAMPTITTKEGKPVAFQLSNDLVYVFPIQVTDAAGNVVPAPPGDSYTAVGSDNGTILGLSVSGGNLTVTPLVATDSTPVTVTVTDQDGLQADPAQFTVAAGAPANITLGTPTTTPQPIPTQPGPG
jgi:hypothetical protein